MTEELRRRLEHLFRLKLMDAEGTPMEQARRLRNLARGRMDAEGTRKPRETTIIDELIEKTRRPYRHEPDVEQLHLASPLWMVLAGVPTATAMSLSTLVNAVNRMRLSIAATSSAVEAEKAKSTAARLIRERLEAENVRERIPKDAAERVIRDLANSLTQINSVECSGRARSSSPMRRSVRANLTTTSLRPSTTARNWSSGRPAAGRSLSRR